MLTISCFVMDRDLGMFDDYLRIKYEVFVAEQGWPLPCDPSSPKVLADPFDAVSLFVLARGPSGQAVGTARGTLLNRGFPREELFWHHFHAEGITFDRQHLATVNAVAVRWPFRGQPLAVENQSTPLTAGKALMCWILNWLRAEGAWVTLITTRQGSQAIFFHRLGFNFIDSPFRISSLPFEFVNMGLVLNDYGHLSGRGSPLAETCPKRELSAEEQCCKIYFEARHQSILQGRNIRDYGTNIL